MIKVYGVHASPFVRKVFIALDFKEIPFELVRQMPFVDDPEYRKLNPLGKVPTLVDGELVLGDSKVICRYIESAYPQKPLYPADKSERAMTEWYEDLGGNRLAELATGIFFQRYMRPNVLKQETDEGLVSNIIERQLPPMLDYLEAQVPEDSFIFGNFSMADLSLVSPFINAEYAGYSVDADQWPKFARLMNDVKGIDEVSAVLAKERKVLGID